MSHLETNDINSAQHGFRPGYSCTSQLINTVEHLAKDMDSPKQIDVISLKHLILYPINAYLQNYMYYGINNKMYHWVSSWLTK